MKHNKNTVILIVIFVCVCSNYVEIGEKKHSGMQKSKAFALRYNICEEAFLSGYIFVSIFDVSTCIWLNIMAPCLFGAHR